MASMEKPNLPSLAAQARAAVQIVSQSSSPLGDGVASRHCIAPGNASSTSPYPTHLLRPLQFVDTRNEIMMLPNPDFPSPSTQIGSTNGLRRDSIYSEPRSPTANELTDSVLHKSEALLRYLADFDRDADNDEYDDASECHSEDQGNLPSLEGPKEPENLQAMLLETQMMIRAQIADRQAKLAEIQVRKDSLVSSTASMSTCPPSSCLTSPQTESPSSAERTDDALSRTDSCVTLAPILREASPRRTVTDARTRPLARVASAHDPGARLSSPPPRLHRAALTRQSASSPRLHNAASFGQLPSFSMLSPRQFERPPSCGHVGPPSLRHSLPSACVSQTVTVTTSVQSAHGNVTTNIQSTTRTHTRFQP